MNLGLVNIVNIVPIEILNASWLLIGFENTHTNMGDSMHLALLYKDNYKSSKDLRQDASRLFSNNNTSPVLRIHSECILGDALHSSLCDCGEQLEHSLQEIMQHGSGILLYLRQEGRGIGLRAKLACLAAQEGYVNGVRQVGKMTPDEANIYCGHKIDERSYDIVPEILLFIGVKKAILITSNVDKINAVKASGVEIESISDIDRSDIPIESRKHCELSEKAKRNYLLGAFL